VTRHLPRTSPFHRLRRSAGALPSGLPTTVAGIAAAILVGAQLLGTAHGAGMAYRPDAARSIPVGAPDARTAGPGTAAPEPSTMAIAQAHAAVIRPTETVRPRSSRATSGHAVAPGPASAPAAASSATAGRMCVNAETRLGGARGEDHAGRAGTHHRSDRAHRRSCSRHEGSDDGRG
jgi:hypothetical protein